MPSVKDDLRALLDGGPPAPNPVIPPKKAKKVYVPKMSKTKLDYDVLLTCVNNYLKGYKRAYENAKHDELSEVKKKYELVLKEREKLLKL